MHGIVTLLDDEHDQKVTRLWQELDLDCGLRGVSLTPIAHFSWHVALEYDMQHLPGVMQGLAAAARPFVVRSAGLGIFTGPAPVIYIALVKDDPLMDFHHQLYRAVLPLAARPSPYYDPDAWMPHITLTYGDKDLAALECALGKVLYRPLEWQIPVDNLALISQAEGHVGERSLSFQLGAPSR
jgi:2'-5' RNA ligase